MSRPPIAERADAVAELRGSWPTLLREVGAFAAAAPDGSVSKLGRLEVFLFLYEWPARVDAQVARERGRAAAGNGHAPSGGAVMKR